MADARAALAALDSTARQLPNPTLLRSPTLRTEAQSTSALEGTYAPLAQVLTADEDEPGSPDMREILNYLRMANHGLPGWLRAVPLRRRCSAPQRAADDRDAAGIGDRLAGIPDPASIRPG